MTISDGGDSSNSRSEDQTIERQVCEAVRNSAEVATECATNGQQQSSAPVEEGNFGTHYVNTDSSCPDLDSVLALAAVDSGRYEETEMYHRRRPVRARMGREDVAENNPCDEAGEECKEEITEPLSRLASTIDSTPVAATVLETEGACNAVDVESDARIARAVAEEEELLFALKLSAYEGGGRIYGESIHDFYSERNGSSEASAQEATVVEITESEYYYSTNRHGRFGDAVCAELVGQDFHSCLNDSNRAASAVAPMEDVTTEEATVIDSAPMEEKNPNSGFTEEAQVLVDNNVSDNASDLDRKPAAVDRRRSSRGRRRNQEAEVLAIEDSADLHPLEREEDALASRAQLVGTDSSYTVAVPAGLTTSAESATVTDGGHVEEIVAPRALAFVDASASRSRIEATTTVAAAVGVPLSAVDDLDSGSACGNVEVIVDEDGSMTGQNVGGIDRLPGMSPARKFSTRRILSDIAEQEGEVVSIQEDEDIHPVVLAERRHGDSEAELIGLENVEVDQREANGRCSVVEDAETILTTQSFPDQLEETGGITVSSTGEGFMGEGHGHENDEHQMHSEIFREEHAAEVLEIRSVEDIHPSEIFREQPHTADAQLVGTSMNVQDPVISPVIQTATEDRSVELEVAVAIDVIPVEEQSLESTTLKTTSLSNGTNAARHADDDNCGEVLSPLDRDNVNNAVGALHEFNRTCSERETTTTYLPRGSDACSWFQDRDREMSLRTTDPFSTDWLHIPSINRENIHSQQEDSYHGSEDNIEKRALRDDCRRNTSQSLTQLERIAGRPVIQRLKTETINLLSEHLARGTSNVIDALFGDTPARAIASDEDAAQSVLPRTLLPWSVVRSPTSRMWVATLQTNQKALDQNNVVEASKSLKAFSMSTEKQAICLARAWTPPRMFSFMNNKFCHICTSKFAIFRRACHCRNCGVCVCKDCAVQWPSKMLPDTYNIKNENFVNVCKSCNWLCNSFRIALLEGQHDHAVALHATGNVNLHTPFANVKGELFYPVHCAVLGGNIDLLKFLVDEHCCPIKSFRVAKNAKNSKTIHTPIITSKGRSLIGIALENEHLDILRYLVAERGVTLSIETDVTPELLCRSFEKLLRMTPIELFSGNVDVVVPLTRLVDVAGATAEQCNPETARMTNDADFREVEFLERAQSENEHGGGDNDDTDECIICCDRSIDCVATPCGHQICCLQCSENLSSRCPVCSSSCSYMRIFKP